MSGFTAFMSDTDSDTFFSGMNLTLNTLFVAENIWQKRKSWEEQIRCQTYVLYQIKVHLHVDPYSWFSATTDLFVVIKFKLLVSTSSLFELKVNFFWSVVLPKHSIVLQAVNYVFREICILLLMHVYVNRASHMRIIHFYDP